MKPLVLVILDGWGEWDIESGNALAHAKMPNIENLNKYYPRLLLQASGLSVGLPWGVRGNSEVGHQTMGVGQIIFQYLPAIDLAIQSGTINQNQKILEAIEESKKRKSKIHLLGLLSDGSVHSHINHLMALLGIFKDNSMDNVFVHAITDGRDTLFRQAAKYFKEIAKNMDDLKTGKLATFCGRYYAMDRNNNWDRVEKAFLAMTKGVGITSNDPLEALERQYASNPNLTDEYLEPVNITDENGQPIGLIEDGDVVICFNFRKDRARQISQAFVSSDFSGFNRPIQISNIKYYCFVEYEKDLCPNIIFSEQKISTRVGELLSQSNKTQLRIAETEKYAHVTYFFNGGIETPFPGEDRLLVQSKKVSSYAEAPEMSAHEVTEKLLEAVNSEKYDFILVNYANPDMVGHTGDFKAGIKAAEIVDDCLGRLINSVMAKKGALLITADHGNIEEMINLTTYQKDTEHSTNPVPCWLVSGDYQRAEPLKDKPSREIEGMIVDIPPTVLDLMEIKKPKDMVGISLLTLFKKRL